MTRRVSYADGRAALDCEVIAAWNRGEVDPVTGASGLKDYFRNQVWSVFDSAPQIDRIVMLRASSLTFALFRVAGHWHDATGQAVTIQPAAQEAAHS